MNIDDELDGLKKIRKVEAPPFLYTRIKGRLDTLERVPKPWAWSFAAAALVVLSLNTGIVLLQSKSKPGAEQESSMAEVVSMLQLSTNNDLYHE